MRSFGKTRAARVWLRVLLYGGFFFVGIPLAFSQVMTKTYKSSSLGRPPRDYEELALLCDGLKLRAWLAKGDAGKPAVVIVHGLGDSLESYLEHTKIFRE